MTHLDTAEMYGSGRVEELLGEAIAGIPRESNLHYEQSASEQRADTTERWMHANVVLAIGAFEYFDLYLLHWPASIRSRRPCARSNPGGTGKDALRRRQQLRSSTKCSKRGDLLATFRSRAIRYSIICASAASSIALIPAQRAARHGDRRVHARSAAAQFPRGAEQRPAACSSGSPRNTARRRAR